MKLIKRNNIIYIDYLVGAKRIRKSLKLQWNKKNLNYVQSEVIPKLMKQIGLDKDYTLKELCEKVLEDSELKLKHSSYLSKKAIYSTIFKYLIDKNIKTYSVYDIQEFADKMYKDNYTSAYIKSLLNIISQAFTLAIKMAIVDFNPVFKISVKKRYKIVREIYSKEQIKLMLDEAKGYLKTFLYIAIFTGARAGEILALTQEDIKDDYIIINKTIVIRTGMIQTPKNGKTRYVYIPDELKEALKSFKGFNCSYATITQQFINLCNLLGLKYSGLHSLRHTYASILLNDKVNPLIIKENLGHKDLKMLENVYGHFTGLSNEDKLKLQNSLFIGI
ncbi:site-specific integrase [Campylobacter sp. faydin G-105]|uniref:tyrosine-type recombinase/integrase n=1 Tax=Campylobacter anatolicus TaxID=2829105 RepID=UPI001B94F7A3|nr:site-specific integrase [Campylobacter anatolicus]MBR8461598.1 site-specific integrase [Campylobacter anatolicus]